MNEWYDEWTAQWSTEESKMVTCETGAPPSQEIHTIATAIVVLSATAAAEK